MFVGTPIDDPDPELVDACGDEPGSVCEWMWDRTGNETLATITDWFVGVPLSILVILLIAWIVSWLARRAVRKTVYRFVVTDRHAAVAALARVSPIGDAAASVTVPAADPRKLARATSISAVVASTVTVLIWVMALFLVLGELGIDLAPLIAGAGIAGVALGFGAQSIVKDCLSGLFILIEDQYGIGDVVDLGEASGSVERITLRSTVLRGLDGTVWHVPNGEIVRVGNSSQLWSVAVVDVVVGYDADVDLASRVVEETAKGLVESEEFSGDVLEAPELLGVEAASADGVLLRLTVKTTAGQQYRLQRALRHALKVALEAAGVPMPPPRPFWSGQPPA